MTEDRVASPARRPGAPTVAPATRDGTEAAFLRTLADRFDAGEVELPGADVSAVLRRAADGLEQAGREAEQALASALRWKERAVASWADNSRGAAADRAELVDLRDHAHALSNELDAIKRTLSWRLTAPLRGARRLRPGRAR